MLKQYFRNYLVAFAFMLSAVCCSVAQNTLQTEVKVGGGITTLYAIDPLARTFCFGDGHEGGTFQQNQVRNRCSDVDFNTYNEGSFTVGVEGGRIGAIIDLGNASELQKRYGYEETVGKGQGFASLRVANGKVFVLKDRRTHSEQELTESISLFAESKSSANSPVKVGHIYLLRLVNNHDKTFERIVKLLVIAYTPNESVTIRWQLL